MMPTSSFEAKTLEDVSATAARVPSPLVVLLVAWGLPLAALALELVQYDGVNFESVAILYLAACLFLYMIGFKLGTLRQPYSGATLLSQAEIRTHLRQDVRRFQRLITFFSIAGILAAVLFSVEMLFVVGVDPMDFEATRAAFTSRDATILSQMATVLGAGGYLSLVAVIVGWECIPRFKRILWLLAPMLLSVFSFLSAGRQTMLQLILIAFFALLVRGGMGGSRSRRTILSIVSGIVIVFALGYGMAISSLRSGEAISGSKADMLSSIVWARLDSSLASALDDQPALIRDGSAEFLFYFTHSIPSFLVFFDLPRPGPYGGMWELPFLGRRLESLGVISTSETGRIDHVYALYAATGRSPSVWQTAVRDLIIDFGDVGAMIVITIFGFGAGKVYYRLRIHGDLISAFFLVGIDLLCVYSVLVSGISDTLIFFYFVAALLMYFRYQFRQQESAAPTATQARMRSLR